MCCRVCKSVCCNGVLCAANLVLQCLLQGVSQSVMQCVLQGVMQGVDQCVVQVVLQGENIIL